MGQTFSTVARYWHTLRYLRTVQIYGRAWFRFNRPKVDTRTAPSLRPRAGPWDTPVARPAMMQSSTGFRFLNRDGCVESADDWNNAGQSKLWLYNLHYFDDLNAVDASERCVWHRSFIERWIKENPPPVGNGWEPYPLSLRIVNWIKWALSGNNLRTEWQHSLAVQVRFLSKRLEWHLLGNHLFANAKALVFAGLFFDGAEAERWLQKGLSILGREIPEQIFPDGGHFELSPMYHAIILEDLLDLINLSNTYKDKFSPTIVEDWRTTAQSMRNWLSIMCHPDGEISFFNDAAFGIAPHLYLIDSYAERLDLPPVKPLDNGLIHLEDSGYIRVQHGEMVAFIDVARIGPDYIPGHAHADTLSFELSLYGHRVIVNSGISQYGTGPERAYQRSTAAHNTLEVDHENSSEVWGGFRVARRARPVDLDIVEKADEIRISCAHDGYHRLKRPVTHRREWRFRSGSLEIIDTVDGKYDEAIARYYLHPIIVPHLENESGSLAAPSSKMLHWRVSGGRCSIRDANWYPEFGKSQPTKYIAVGLSTPQCQMTMTW